MVNRWVVNASPIISLVKIDRIHLLSELCDEVIIPQGVRDEITLGDTPTVPLIGFSKPVNSSSNLHQPLTPESPVGILA